MGRPTMPSLISLMAITVLGGCGSLSSGPRAITADEYIRYLDRGLRFDEPVVRSGIYYFSSYVSGLEPQATEKHTGGGFVVQKQVGGWFQMSASEYAALREKHGSDLEIIRRLQKRETEPVR